MPPEPHDRAGPRGDNLGLFKRGVVSFAGGPADASHFGNVHQHRRGTRGLASDVTSLF